MDEGLTAFFVSTAAQPWEWGRTDCTMWVADWCRRRWGVDPAAAYRDRYATEAEMLALTAGGLLRLVEPTMSFARLTDDPQDGDVGVIELGGKQVSAIRCDARWAFRTPAGVAFRAAPALAAWSD